MVVARVAGRRTIGETWRVRNNDAPSFISGPSAVALQRGPKSNGGWGYTDGTIGLQRLCNRCCSID